MFKWVGQRCSCGSAWRIILMAVVLLAIGAVGCERKRVYSQSTPEDVIKSAVSMVQNNDARQLSNLVYADSPEMKALMDRVGRLFENLQRLSGAASKRWPEEYAAMQAEALKGATEKTPGLLGMLSEGGAGRGRAAASAQQNPDQLRGMFNAVLADPYGWMERNASRLSAVKTSDDTGAVLIDGEPAIPVVGLPLKMEGGKWYVALPTNMPPISSFWPRTRQQWSILGSFVQVLDNAVIGLTKSVEDGQVGSMKQLTDKFQEKVMFPGMIAFGAYGKEIDVRERLDRRMKLFQTKLRTWSEARKERQGDAGAVSTKVQQAILSLAPAELEKGVRANKPSGLDKMTDGVFEDLIGGWLKSAGLAISIDGELSGAVADKAVDAWNAQRKAAATAKKK